jgi:hypothetical protein
MMADRHGRAVRGQLADNIDKAILAHGIDLVALDPFVKTHSVEENLNSIIEAQVLTDLATKHNIAVDAPHHISKGPSDPGNANRGRGASSMVDAARLVYTLNPMSADEAKRFRISEADRWSYIRVDSGKINIAKQGGRPRWFRLVGVQLGNATPTYPAGDEVQTVEPWTAPAEASLSLDQVNRILDQLDQGLPDGDRYSDAGNAGNRAAWKVVIEHTITLTEVQARETIKKWVEDGLLVPYEYASPVSRKTGVRGLRVDPTKRPT